MGVGEEALYNYLEDKSALLILDNREHMVDGCAEFTGSLLQRAPNITVLATSQEALGIAGETVHRVPSLLVPDSAQSPMEALTKCPAVRLFVERAATVQPGFALTDENSVAVTQITQRLDGIPLAIELAAAWINVLPAEQIADRLDDAFRLLTRGRRTDPPDIRPFAAPSSGAISAFRNLSVCCSISCRYFEVASLLRQPRRSAQEVDWRAT